MAARASNKRPEPARHYKRKRGPVCGDKRPNLRTTNRKALNTCGRCQKVLDAE